MMKRTVRLQNPESAQTETETKMPLSPRRDKTLKEWSGDQDQAPALQHCAEPRYPSATATPSLFNWSVFASERDKKQQQKHTETQEENSAAFSRSDSVTERACVCVRDGTRARG